MTDENSRTCCNDPGNYQLHIQYGREAETGYAHEDYFECCCGERIGVEDFDQLCSWAAQQPEAIPPQMAPALREERKTA